jgi:hypothetical protein
MNKNSRDNGWEGWVYFAGILMLVKAFFQAFLGFVSLSKEDFFSVSENSLAVFNFTAWGWSHLIISVVLLTAGFSVLSGQLWGRVVGVIAFSISLLVNMVFLPAYPLWLAGAIIIDAIILYALIVHGGKTKLE